MQGLHARRDHHLAGAEPARDGDERLVEAQHLDVADRYRLGRWIDDPDGRLPIEARQRGGRDLYGAEGLFLHASGDRRTEAHGGRRIDQADLHLESPGHGVGLWRNFSHTAVHDHGRVLREADADLRIARGSADELGRHVEYSIAPALAGQLGDHLSRLNDLAGSWTYR